MARPVFVECTFTYHHYDITYDSHDYHNQNGGNRGPMSQVLEFPSLAHFLAIKKDPRQFDAAFFLKGVHEISINKILDYSVLTRRTIRDRPVYKVMWTQLPEL